MCRFIIIFTFFIQSNYAAFVKWGGQDPLSVSVGGYFFFATNNNDIYKFDGTAVTKLVVPDPPLAPSNFAVKFQSESFIKCGDKMCPAVILLGDTKGILLKPEFVGTADATLNQDLFDTLWPTDYSKVQKILAYPRKVRQEFEHYNFLAIVTKENNDYSIYTAKVIESVTDTVSMHSLMNYAVNATFTSATYQDATLSIVRSAVCVHYTSDSGSDTHLYNSSFPDAGDALSEITLAGSTGLKVQLSEASTGGMFLWKDSELFYSSFEGYLPSRLKYNNANFPPSGETITSLVSGEHGDFLVVTDTGAAPPNNRKVYYGKEGYFRVNIEEVTFADESTDSTCQECNFALQSMEKIVQLRCTGDSTGDFNTTADVFDLRTLTEAQFAIKPCVIYDNYMENETVFLDSKETYTPVATLRGITPVSVVVNTPVPNDMILSYTTEDSRERNELYTKKIGTLLDPKDTKRDEAGTRVVPFVSWYITDTDMSCTKPSFAVSLIHYGTCPIKTRVIDEDVNETLGKWVYAGIHSTTHFVLTNVIQHYLDNDVLQKHNKKVKKGYLDGQIGFTNSEQKRGSGNCTEVKCPFQRFYYMSSFMIEANVGRPFLPEFKLVGDDLEDFDFAFKEHTLVVLGEITGGSGFMGSNTEKKTFNLVKNTMELINKESRSYGKSARGIFEMNDVHSNTSVYQYTFNGQVAGCTGSQQSYIRRLDSIREGLGKTRSSTFTVDDFDFKDVWNRRNFVSCRKNTNAQALDSTVSELNTMLTVPAQTLIDNRENINKRIRNSIIDGIKDENGDYDEHLLDSILQIPANTSSFAGYEPLLCSPDGITDKGCTNQFIFTKPGRYIMSAILLDPNASGCDLRVSFIVKVHPLPDNSIWANITFLMLRNTVLVTSLVFLWYFLEPIFSRGADRLQNRLETTMDINIDEY